MRFFDWLRGLAYPCLHLASGFRVAHTYCHGRANCRYCQVAAHVQIKQKEER